MFKELNLSKSYSSSRDDILGDFYIPVLKEAGSYRRTTAYFNSRSLLKAAEGLAFFYTGGGKCKLISGLELSPEDFKAVKDGTKSIEDLALATFDLDYFEALDQLQHNTLRYLSWLLSTGRMEIKVAAITDSTNAIYHEKMGVLRDSRGDEISFVGSVNETSAGWTSNAEQFRVFRSWVPEESEYVRIDNEQFEEYWDNKNNKVLTFTLPEAISKKLIKVRPNDKEIGSIVDAITSSMPENQPKPSEVKELRDYQKEAIKNWEANNHRGVFTMATGTGKTLTAIEALKKVFGEKDSIAALVAVPQRALLTQWNKELEKQAGDYKVVSLSNGKKKWIEELDKTFFGYTTGIYDKVIFVGTYNTFRDEDFLKLVNENENNIENWFILADEVHNFSSPKNRGGMLEQYNYRLGLSATPQRYFDDEGTDILMAYFAGIVFDYPLALAIENKFLVNYEYHVKFAYLNADEMEKYCELTDKIKRAYSRGDDADANKYLKTLLIIRSDVLKNAAEKIDKLVEILLEQRSQGNSEQILIYFDDEKQLRMGQEEINNNLTTITHQFTGEEKEKDRSVILRDFTAGLYKMLLSVKCLDEGVDIPTAKTAIILASSGNSKEYIQRRGRVLRRSEGKESAIIYDVLALPPIEYLDDDTQKILEKEFRRVKAFSEDATNGDAVVQDEMFEVMNKYGVYL